MKLYRFTSCNPELVDERNATPISVPRIAPIVLVVKFKGLAINTPRFITMDPSR